MHLIRSLRYNLGHGGLRVVFRKSIKRLGQLAYRSEGWLLLSKDLAAAAPSQVAAGFEVVPLLMDDLRAHGFFKALYYPETLAERLEKGELCLGILVDGALAHVAWMAYGRLPLDPGLPDFPAGDAGGIYDMFTLPDFRRRGCQTLALVELERRAAEQGLRRTVAVVDPGNRPSLSVFERCGYQIRGRLSYRRVLWHSRLALIPREA
jgi:GNAT superfamily N-acetyltransferase